MYVLQIRVVILLCTFSNVRSEFDLVDLNPILLRFITIRVFLFLMYEFKFEQAHQIISKIAHHLFTSKQYYYIFFYG